MCPDADCLEDRDIVRGGRRVKQRRSGEGKENLQVQKGQSSLQIKERQLSGDGRRELDVERERERENNGASEKRSALQRKQNETMGSLW